MTSCNKTKSSTSPGKENGALEKKRFPLYRLQRYCSTQTTYNVIFIFGKLWRHAFPYYSIVDG